MLRRSVLLNAASVRRRHGHYLGAPFNWAAIVDDRTVPGELETMQAIFNRVKPCCHRPGLARDAREEGVAFTDASFKRRAACFAGGVTLSLSNTERLHAVNKAFNRGAGGCAAFSNMCCHAVNCAAKSQQAKRRQEHTQLLALQRETQRALQQPALSAIAVGVGVPSGGPLASGPPHEPPLPHGPVK
jgi:hypothetical protein